jgi:hypothetical protein
MVEVGSSLFQFSGILYVAREFEEVVPKIALVSFKDVYTCAKFENPIDVYRHNVFQKWREQG